MKSYNLIIFIITTLLISCNKVDTLPPQNQFFNLILHVTDEKGNNLVEDIPTYFDTRYSEYYINSEICKYNIYIDGEQTNYASTSKSSVFSTLDNEQMLMIHSDLADKAIDECVMTYNIYCPYVFGNEDLHTIVVNWKLSGIDKKHISDNILYNKNRVSTEDIGIGTVAYIVLGK